MAKLALRSVSLSVFTTLSAKPVTAELFSCPTAAQPRLSFAPFGCAADCLMSSGKEKNCWLYNTSISLTTVKRASSVICDYQLEHFGNFLPCQGVVLELNVTAQAEMLHKLIAEGSLLLDRATKLSIIQWLRYSHWFVIDRHGRSWVVRRRNL